jgi:hypothetical protein
MTRSYLMYVSCASYFMMPGTERDNERVAKQSAAKQKKVCDVSSFHAHKNGVFFFQILYSSLMSFSSMVSSSASVSRCLGEPAHTHQHPLPPFCLGWRE